MNRNGIRNIRIGAGLIAAFALWTVLILSVDVQPVGVNGTDVGFASLNTAFHALTGVHMGIYTVTDWLGAVPFAVCAFFGCVGLRQWIRRKKLLQVDADILLLGLYYLIVIGAFFFFERYPVNFRPILIDGKMEASYPSSSTLLTLSVMPTLVLQSNRRLKSTAAKRMILVLSILFSAFMVLGRLGAGVHWLTDIIGGSVLSAGLFCVYTGTVLRFGKGKGEGDA